MGTVLPSVSPGRGRIWQWGRSWFQLTDRCVDEPDNLSSLRAPSLSESVSHTQVIILATCCLFSTELKLLWLNYCEENDSLERGPQTLEQSVDTAHTRGHKNPEPSDPDPVELETWRTVESGQQTRWVKPCTDNSSWYEHPFESVQHSQGSFRRSHLTTHALSEWASLCQPL